MIPCLCDKIGLSMRSSNSSSCGALRRFLREFRFALLAALIHRARFPEDSLPSADQQAVGYLGSLLVESLLDHL